MASILDGIIIEGAIGQHRSFQQAHKHPICPLGEIRKEWSSPLLEENKTLLYFCSDTCRCFLPSTIPLLLAKVPWFSFVSHCSPTPYSHVVQVGLTPLPGLRGQDLSLTKPDIPFPWPWWSVLSCWPIGVNSGTLAGIDGKECSLPVGDISQELQVAIVILSWEELACK